MSNTSDINQTDDSKENADDQLVKTEEEIWCDYREIMYNAWAEKQKNK